MVCLSVFAVGPKVTVIGDSYSTYVGTQPSGYAVYYDGSQNGVTSVNQQYWMRVINKLGGTLDVNNAWSGSYLGLYSDGASASMIGDARLAQLGDPDLVLICAGTNDSWQDKPIGEPVYHDNLSDYTAAEKAQVSPAMCYLIKWLRVNKPNAEIMIVSNSYDDGPNRPGIKKQICDDQATIAEHYGVMHVQCHGIHKQERHPDVEGFYTMSEQILEVYYAAHRNEELVSAEEYSGLATSDDPTMRVVRTPAGFAYVFTSTNGMKTFTAQTDLIVSRALVVGGGGAGGWTVGAGGGGGQVLDLLSADLPDGGIVGAGDTLAISVAAGGLNQFSSKISSSGNTDGCRLCRGGSGGASSVEFSAGTVSANGGGGGGAWFSQNGCDGANGGGGCGGLNQASPNPPIAGTGGAGATGGYRGGNGYVKSTTDMSVYTYNAPGGGGGADGAGADAAISQGGAGGAAKTSDILGYTVSYGGGGGGGSGHTTSPGLGAANAGDGADNVTYVCGRPARDGFGGGGGGGGYAGSVDTCGGNGGSGTVILLVNSHNDPLAPVVSATKGTITPTTASLTLSLSDLGEGGSSADVYFGYAVDGEARPALAKVAGDSTGGNFPQALTSLNSDTRYRYWYTATNDLANGMRVASGVFSTGSILPGYDVEFSDRLLVASTASVKTHSTDEGFVYVFPSVGTHAFAFREEVDLVRALVVGGGGAGGWTLGGGGGGGAVKEIAGGYVFAGEAMSALTVGAGGAGGNTSGAPESESAKWLPGQVGGASTLTLGETAYVANGGGGGGSFLTKDGLAGANGGGAAPSYTAVVAGGAGEVGGSSGGASYYCNFTIYGGEAKRNSVGGGGGGAGGAGAAGTFKHPGHGGAGVYCDITGRLECYGAGGGAGCGNNATVVGFGGDNAGDGGYVSNGSGNFADIRGRDGFGGGGGGGALDKPNSIGYAGGGGGCGAVILVVKPKVGAKPMATVKIADTAATSTRFAVTVTDFGTGADSAEVSLAYAPQGSLMPSYVPYGSLKLTGLAAGTIYDYRVRVVNNLGVAREIDGSFATPSLTPSFTAVYADARLYADAQLTLTETSDGFAYVFADPSKTANVLFRDSFLLSGLLVVGGGGAGGTTIGGGGGGGEVVEYGSASNFVVLAGQTARFRPGEGGVRKPASSAGEGVRQPGFNGEPSYLKVEGLRSVVAIGGGGGGGWGAANGQGKAGANGGGGAYKLTGGAATAAGGHPGGAGYVASSAVNYGPGGGGGMNGDGVAGTATAAGAGGVGVLSSITGTELDYGSGGGGGAGNSVVNSGAAGGSGAGAGGTTAGTAGGNGADGRGGGGGGGGWKSGSEGLGGLGGSGGIVLALASLDSSTPKITIEEFNRGVDSAMFSVTVTRLGDDAKGVDVAYRYRIAGGEFSQWIPLTAAAPLGWKGLISLTSLAERTDYELEVKAVNDLAVSESVTLFFATISLDPEFTPTYTDDFLATSVPLADFEVRDVGSAKAYVFKNTTSGQIFTKTALKLRKLLLVGGGGAGGMTIGGGGGGGAVKEVDVSIISSWQAATYATFKAGQGGDPGTYKPTWYTRGGNGGDTTLSFGANSYTASGGGGGGSWAAAAGGGASGGGASGPTTMTGAAASDGNAGGNCVKGSGTNDTCAGGGGGAAEKGENGMTVNQRSGKGGEGVANSITGVAVVYGSGGGGGGGNGVDPAPGGTNAGAGGAKTGSVGGDAVNGYGGGGGGGGFTAKSSSEDSQGYIGGKGGSGTVVFLFSDPQNADAEVVATPFGAGELAIRAELKGLSFGSDSADVYVAYGAVGSLGEYVKVKTDFAIGRRFVYNLGGLTGMDEVAYSVKFVDANAIETLFNGTVSMGGAVPAVKTVEAVGVVALTNCLSAKMSIDLVDSGSAVNTAKVYLAVAPHGEALGEPVLIDGELGLDETLEHLVEGLASETEYDYLLRVTSFDGARTNDSSGSFTTLASSAISVGKPVIDRAARTIKFTGAFTKLGAGTTTVKVVYGPRDNKELYEVELAVAEESGELVAFESEPIACDTAENPMKSVYYRFVVVETLTGREIYRTATNLRRASVFEKGVIVSFE